MMESTKAGLKAWLLSIFSMELPFICLWMHRWHIVLWKHSSPFAPGRWYLDYVLPLSHTLVSEHAHVGNAQHDSKVSWLDSRCSTDCPTGNVLIILPNFTLVVSTHWSSTRPTISVLAISRLNLSFCAWPEFPPLINYQLTKQPIGINELITYCITPVPQLFSWHTKWLVTDKSRIVSLLNIWCPVCCRYPQRHKKTFFIEDGNARLYILKDTYNHIVSEKHTTAPDFKSFFLMNMISCCWFGAMMLQFPSCKAWKWCWL